MKLHIRKPYFSAWKKFGWPKGMWGVGINKNVITQAIDDEEPLEVRVGDDKKTYFVDPETAKLFSQRNKTQFLVNNKTLLYVIPNTMLTRKGEDNGEPTDGQAVQQETLF